MGRAARTWGFGALGEPPLWKTQGPSCSELSSVTCKPYLKTALSDGSADLRLSSPICLSPAVDRWEGDVSRDLVRVTSGFLGD